MNVRARLNYCPKNQQEEHAPTRPADICAVYGGGSKNREQMLEKRITASLSLDEF